MNGKIPIVQRCIICERSNRPVESYFFDFVHLVGRQLKLNININPFGPELAKIIVCGPRDVVDEGISQLFYANENWQYNFDLKLI